MTRIVLDDAVISKIPDLTEFAELCDEAGRTVGYFYPVGGQDDGRYVGIESPFSDEELDRREREPGGSTLAEIWQRLDPK